MLSRVRVLATRAQAVPVMQVQVADSTLDQVVGSTRGRAVDFTQVPVVGSTLGQEEECIQVLVVDFILVLEAAYILVLVEGFTVVLRPTIKTPIGDRGVPALRAQHLTIGLNRTVRTEGDMFTFRTRIKCRSECARVGSLTT